MQHWRT